MEPIGDRLKRLRTEAGLTQSQLASSTVSASYISLVEAGKRVPGAEVVAHLASRLGCTPQHLQHGAAGDVAARVRQEVTFAQVALAEGHWAVALQRLDVLVEGGLLEDLDAGSEGGLDADLAYEVALTRGQAHQSLGHLEEAVAIFIPLLREAVEQNRYLRQLSLANAVTVCYLGAADLEEAARVARESIDVGERVGLVDTDEHVRLVATLAWVLFEQGDLLAARDLLHRAMAAAEQSASPLARGSLYWNASLVAAERGNHADAHDLARRALALMSEHAGQRDVARLRAHYGYLLLRGDDPVPQAALEQLQRAEVDLRRVADIGDIAACRTEEARALVMLGRAEEGEQRVGSALQLLQESATSADGQQHLPRLETVEALLVLAQCHEALGDVAGATAEYEQAATMLSMLRIGRRAATAWRELAERLQRRGDAQGALRAYRESLDAAGVVSSVGERSRSSS
ncbi:MAG: helix-turn-helix domain-containing protein [Quadrisphaera sp.]